MRFFKSVGALTLAFTLAPLLAGCIFSPDKGGNLPPPGYLPDTSPENVVSNISAVYIRRDATKYEEVLGSNYKFDFQEADISTGQADSLIRAEEIEFAHHLFETGSTGGTQPAASKIALTISINSSGPDSRVGHQGWLQYNVQTVLQITLSDGNGFNVNSPATFWFRQEPDGSGHWKLAEWKDLPGEAAPSLLASVGALKNAGRTAPLR